jgi:predicted deacylase
MSLQGAIREDTVVLVAPRRGMVRFLAPPAPAGELEVFAAGDAVAVVESAHGDEAVAAPASGFIVRQEVPDRAQVDPLTPLLVLRTI